jgi:hypothetical protein
MQDIIAQAIIDNAEPAATETVATEAPVTEAADADAGAAEKQAATEPTSAALPEVKVDETALFSDAALAKPEGIKAAADHLRAKSRDAQKREFVISKRQDKLREKVHAFAAEKEAVAADRNTVAQLGQQLRQDVAALQRGSAKEILSTIGRLTGREPADIYREMSHLMVTDGKSNGKSNPEFDALKKEIADLKAAREEETRLAQESAYTQAEQQAMDRIYSVAADAAKYPAIASTVALDPSVKTEVRDWLADYKRKNYNAQTDTAVSDDAAAQALEQLLLAAKQPAGSTGAQAAKSAPGPAPSKPVTKPAVSLTSSDISAPAQRRPKTDGHTVEELAADESFMSALF